MGSRRPTTSSTWGRRGGTGAAMWSRAVPPRRSRKSRAPTRDGSCGRFWGAWKGGGPWPERGERRRPLPDFPGLEDRERLLLREQPLTLRLVEQELHLFPDGVEEGAGPGLPLPAPEALPVGVDRQFPPGDHQREHDAEPRLDGPLVEAGPDGSFLPGAPRVRGGGSGT